MLNVPTVALDARTGGSTTTTEMICLQQPPTIWSIENNVRNGRIKRQTGKWSWLTMLAAHLPTRQQIDTSAPTKQRKRKRGRGTIVRPPQLIERKVWHKGRGAELLRRMLAATDWVWVQARSRREGRDMRENEIKNTFGCEVPCHREGPNCPPADLRPCRHRGREPNTSDINMCVIGIDLRNACVDAQWRHNYREDAVAYTHLSFIKHVYRNLWFLLRSHAASKRTSRPENGVLSPEAKQHDTPGAQPQE